MPRHETYVHLDHLLAPKTKRNRAQIKSDFIRYAQHDPGPFPPVNLASDALKSERDSRNSLKKLAQTGQNFFATLGPLIQVESRVTLLLLFLLPPLT